MLRELGVGVALDDFGTGYSSLVSLQQLPLTRVKLDRSLIATIDTSARSQAITRAIISLCQSLGLEVTAEGVERHEQLAWLLGYPAMHLQGYLLSPPVPEADLLTALNAMPARMDELLQDCPAAERRADRAAARSSHSASCADAARSGFAEDRDLDPRTAGRRPRHPTRP